MFNWPWRRRSERRTAPLAPLPPPPHPEAANIETARAMLALGVKHEAAADWLVRQCPGVFPDASYALEAILAGADPA